MAAQSMDALPDGSTRLHFTIGDPIEQVKSPAGMTRTFLARGHNALCVPMHVVPADLAAFIENVSRAKNVDGLRITVPHKFASAAFCSELSDRSRFLGAVNIMRRAADGGWSGDMLDGLAFVAAIRAKGGEPRGQRALLIGAGGAGSAIALALVDAGAASLAIHDEDVARRDSLIARLAAYCTVPISAGTADPRGFDLVANATPAGMRPGDAPPVRVEWLAPETFCACVITQPVPAPWLVVAAARGCPTSDGVDMYQAEQGMMMDFLLHGAAAP